VPPPPLYYELVDIVPAAIASSLCLGVLPSSLPLCPAQKQKCKLQSALVCFYLRQARLGMDEVHVDLWNHRLETSRSALEDRNIGPIIVLQWQLCYNTSMHISYAKLIDTLQLYLPMLFRPDIHPSLVGAQRVLITPAATSLVILFLISAFFI